MRARSPSAAARWSRRSVIVAPGCAGRGAWPREPHGPAVRSSCGTWSGIVLRRVRDHGVGQRAVQPGMRVLGEQLLVRGPLDGGDQRARTLRPRRAGRHRASGPGSRRGCGRSRRRCPMARRPPGTGRVPERRLDTAAEWLLHHSTWASTSLRVQPSMPGRRSRSAASSSPAAAVSMLAWVSRMASRRVVLSMTHSATPRRNGASSPHRDASRARAYPATDARRPPAPSPPIRRPTRPPIDLRGIVSVARLRGARP